MLIFFLLFISGLLGLFIGIYFNVQKLLSTPLVGPLQHSVRAETNFYPPIIRFKSCSFTDLELDFLKKLIQLEELQLPSNNHELNDLLNFGNKKTQNERRDLNLLVKNLNLKLFFIYGIKEGILGSPSELDKRKKCFFLKEELLLKSLPQDILEQSNL